MAAATPTPAADVDDCPPDDDPSTPPPTPAPQGAGGTIWSAPNQQVVRADQSGPWLIVATGATAGIPGAWTPAGANAPSTPAELAAGRPVTVTASPATAWTTGQYVQTATPGAPGRATWTGTGWVGGVAP